MILKYILVYTNMCIYRYLSIYLYTFNGLRLYR